MSRVMVIMASLPDRQLRNGVEKIDLGACTSLPDRQLRNGTPTQEPDTYSSLPDRQLRNRKGWYQARSKDFTAG